MYLLIGSLVVVVMSIVARFQQNMDQITLAAPQPLLNGQTPLDPSRRPIGARSMDPMPPLWPRSHPQKWKIIYWLKRKSFPCVCGSTSLGYATVIIFPIFTTEYLGTKIENIKNSKW